MSNTPKIDELLGDHITAEIDGRKVSKPLSEGLTTPAEILTAKTYIDCSACLKETLDGGQCGYCGADLPQ